MSNEKKIDIYFFDIDQKLFHCLFPDKSKIDKKDYGIIEQKSKTIKIRNKVEEYNMFIPFIIIPFTEYKAIYWNGYNYPELLDNNCKTIILDLFKTISLSQNKNTIIIKFGNSYIKEFSTLINKIQKDKPFILFIFKNDKDNPEDFKNFKNPEFISYMNYNDKENIEKNLEEISKKITSYIWEKQNYFFELGKIHDLFYPNSFIECNILL